MKNNDVIKRAYQTIAAENEFEMIITYKSDILKGKKYRVYTKSDFF